MNIYYSQNSINNIYQVSKYYTLAAVAECGYIRPPSRSRKPLRLAEDILRLASRLAAAYG